jgi:hypothetical protein
VDFNTLGSSLCFQISEARERSEIQKKDGGRRKKGEKHRREGRKERERNTNGGGHKWQKTGTIQ